MPIRLFLASKSPRRRELLHQLGLSFETVDLDLPEVRRPGESPEQYVSRVAHEKAGAGLAQVAGIPGAVVVGADTEVVLGDRVFGKPADADDAKAMLRELSGRTHRVLSAVWLVGTSNEASALNVTDVTFAELSDADIDAYVASGEAFGKAGAYAIQGRAAAFIPRIDGSHSSVMGLPLADMARLLAAFGHG